MHCTYTVRNSKQLLFLNLKISLFWLLKQILNLWNVGNVNYVLILKV
jgi:hypothetical protein